MNKLAHIFSRLDDGQLMVVGLWAMAALAIVITVLYQAIRAYRQTDAKYKGMVQPKQNRFKAEIDKENDSSDLKDAVGSILFIAALFIVVLCYTHGR